MQTNIDRPVASLSLGRGIAAAALCLILALPTLGLTFLVFLFLAKGFVVVGPNEAVVYTLFGKYAGTLGQPGIAFVNPLMSGNKISLRTVNFASQTLKVNDRAGNPIEIAAVVSWRVIAPAAATLDVEDYRAFVAVTAETSIRTLAARYNYDEHEGEGASLRGDADVVANELAADLTTRLAVAGVEINEARISHLAYAPEIAQSMLRRQQAAAVISARKLIVSGAVGMVRDALAEIEGQKVAIFSDAQRAAMVNNLLVALVSEAEATPIINASSVA